MRRSIGPIGWPEGSSNPRISAACFAVGSRIGAVATSLCDVLVSDDSGAEQQNGELEMGDPIEIENFPGNQWQTTRNAEWRRRANVREWRTGKSLVIRVTLVVEWSSVVEIQTALVAAHAAQLRNHGSSIAIHAPLVGYSAA